MKGDGREGGMLEDIGMWYGRRPGLRAGAGVSLEMGVAWGGGFVGEVGGFAG